MSVRKNFNFDEFAIIMSQADNVAVVKKEVKNNYWLTIYAPDGVTKYRSIGGRTLEEMRKHYPKLNQDLTP